MFGTTTIEYENQTNLPSSHEQKDHVTILCDIYIKSEGLKYTYKNVFHINVHTKVVQIMG